MDLADNDAVEGPTNREGICCTFVPQQASKVSTAVAASDVFGADHSAVHRRYSETSKSKRM
jgi:hypothetical protein